MESNEAKGRKWEDRSEPVSQLALAESEGSRLQPMGIIASTLQGCFWESDVSLSL